VGLARRPRRPEGQQADHVADPRAPRRAREAPIAVTDPSDSDVADIVGVEKQRQLVDAIAIIGGAGTTFDRAGYRDGTQTPVFFGSALHDFGVEPFLAALLSLAPSPGPRRSTDGVVEPTDPAFSGFVFKIQANMNPRHRDRVAFFRVCSGRLTKDMLAEHERLGTTLRLARVYRFFGRDRETVPEAFAGDVVGLVNPGLLAIGDTLYAVNRVRFPPIPPFPAERFATLRPKDGGHKKFVEAVRQLAEEGLLQMFVPRTGPRQPIVGVVGALQFDVIAARMASEYGIPCEVEPLSYIAARWPASAGDEAPPLRLPYAGVVPVVDARGRDVLLFDSEWALGRCKESNPDVRFDEAP
jgi:peptide chain release factor 3